MSLLQQFIIWAPRCVTLTVRQNNNILAHQGPVVQSIISLTSSLRGQLVKCFMTLYPNTLIFLLEKWEKLLHGKSFSHFFNKKYWHISDIYVWNFNETLTNDVVSFEQLGLEVKVFSTLSVNLNRLHGPPMLVDKTYFGLVICNHANFCRLLSVS